MLINLLIALEGLNVIISMIRFTLLQRKARSEMVSSLDSGSSGLDSSPDRCFCVLAQGPLHLLNSAFLHLGLNMGTRECLKHTGSGRGEGQCGVVALQ